ncbi:hypothetical protein ACWDA7_40305, partial [Streptomyces sp. NPDC001156]
PDRYRDLRIRLRPGLRLHRHDTLRSLRNHDKIDDQHDPIRWSHPYSHQLRLAATEFELATKIVYVPNIASALVAGLMRSHQR